MSSRIPALLQVAAVLLVLFLAGCKAPNSATAADRELADRLEKLRPDGGAVRHDGLAGTACQDPLVSKSGGFT